MCAEKGAWEGEKRREKSGGGKAEGEIEDAGANIDGWLLIWCFRRWISRWVEIFILKVVRIRVISPRRLQDVNNRLIGI